MWCEDLGIDDWYDKYEYNNEVMGYLRGNCEQWVINNYQDGDKCVAILKNLNLVHCCILRDEQYWDIRGNTYDFENVTNGLEYGEFEIFDTLEEFKVLLEDIDTIYKEIDELE